MPARLAHSSSIAVKRMAWLPLALLACAVLALAGGVSHRHALSLAAALLLLLAWLPEVWHRRSAAGFAAWLVLAALLLVPAALGHAQLALMALPVLFLALACWLFARTLGHRTEPLVARFIRLTDGDAQLELPGVRGYARGVTVFWACLLGAMACLSLAIALVARPGGWFVTLGVSLPVHLPGSLLAWYPELGCWVVLGAAFVGEYLYRRWHLRGVPQSSLPEFLARLVRCWPALARGGDGGA